MRDEKEIVEKLAEVVAGEEAILHQLPQLRFDQKTIGAERLSDEQVAAFGRLVGEHARLVKGLQEQLSSVHMPSPTPDDLREVIRRMLDDFGVDYASERLHLTPEDTAMKLLLKVHQAWHNTLRRRDNVQRELHEEIMETTRSGETEGLRSAADAHFELTMNNIEATRRGYEQEPQLSAEKFYECCRNTACLRMDLQDLVGERWFMNESPGKGRG